jgi:hypothetical protein
VVLKCPQGKRLKTRANAFGNFEFDGLEPGEYVVIVEAAGYKQQVINIRMTGNYYTGAINLVKV